MSGSALGAPAPEDELKVRKVDECKAVTVIISVLSQYKAPATSFCSSFISIPVKTVTSVTVHDLFLAIMEERLMSLTTIDHDLNAKALYGHIHCYNYTKNVTHTSLRSSIGNVNDI